ncbi:MAG: HD domain-containing protein [Candidatus Izimaplasma sp.]|nr:HD domain-containing protein [Candidatus Izimaplasma bacterium]
MSCNIELIIIYVKKLLETETTGHDYFHADRVMKNALHIAKNYDVNLDIIKVSALTHDLIDRKVTDNISLAISLLEKELDNASCSEKDIEEIINIIKTISYSKGNIPISLEGKIVQDADRLDALGAIGIARTFAYGGKNERMIYNPDKNDNMDSISHFYNKLLKLKDFMNTKEAKKIAENRTQYMNEYLNNFYNEWESKNQD